jgi:sulfofructose kinase
MTARVVAIGQCAIDYLGVSERYPEVDSRVEVSPFSIQGGGTVGTALVTLASFGIPCAVFARVGDDDFGRFVTQGLEEHGIDVRGISVEPGAISPFSFISVERHGAKRTVFYTHGSVSPLPKGELNLDRPSTHGLTACRWCSGRARSARGWATSSRWPTC